MDMYDLEKFKEGSEQELKNIMDEYEKPLLRYCYSILFNFTDAEDVVQAVFVKAYFRRDSIKSKETFSAFLYAIAYSESVDIIRKRKKNIFKKSEESTINKNYMSEMVRNALQTLSSEDRAIVYGRIVEEYSYGELAEIHNKKEATLRKRYERAKDKLASELEKCRSVQIKEKGELI